MDRLIYITPNFAVAGVLQPEDFARLRDSGFTAVISNLPDGEDQAHLTSRQGAKHAWQNGLTFRYIPAGKLDLFTDEVVEATEEALRHIEGPVVAHCQSGIRSAIIWAAAVARSQPVDCVLAALEKAGFDLDFIRDDLDEQADRKRWLGTSPALDCADAAGEPVAAKTVAA